jgi:hypothetical protein
MPFDLITILITLRIIIALSSANLARCIMLVSADLALGAALSIACFGAIMWTDEVAYRLNFPGSGASRQILSERAQVLLLDNEGAHYDETIAERIRSGATVEMKAISRVRSLLSMRGWIWNAKIIADVVAGEDRVITDTNSFITVDGEQTKTSDGELIYLTTSLELADNRNWVFNALSTIAPTVLVVVSLGGLMLVRGLMYATKFVALRLVSPSAESDPDHHPGGFLPFTTLAGVIGIAWLIAGVIVKAIALG